MPRSNDGRMEVNHDIFGVLLDPADLRVFIDQQWEKVKARKHDHNDPEINPLKDKDEMPPCPCMMTPFPDEEKDPCFAEVDLIAEHWVLCLCAAHAKSVANQSNDIRVMVEIGGIESGN